MSLLILAGLVVVAIVILIFLFLEREQAVKIASAVVGLYMTLIGVNYGLNVFERDKAEFNSDKAAFNIEFNKQSEKIDCQRNHNCVQNADADKAHAQELQAKLDKANAELAEQTKAHEEAREETRKEIEDLKLKTKRAVDKASSDVLEKN